MKFNWLHSLKSRYAAVSILLSIFVLSGAFLGYRVLSATQSEATTNENRRSSTLDTSRQIRNAVWDSREYMDEFLLDPQVTGVPEKIKQSITSAIKHNSGLIKAYKGFDSSYNDTLVKIDSLLKTLDAQIKVLIETRLDAQKQFPSIGIASLTMQPTENSLFSAVEVALNEILEEDPSTLNSEAYQTFTKIRNLWSRLIANFRMYLVNRVGSFSEEILPLQEKDSELLASEIAKTISQLKQLETDGELGFLGTESLHTIINSFEQWKTGYKQVITIHHSNEWRRDKTILLESIKPLYFEIWDSLLLFENLQQSSSQKDINSLTKISNMQLNVILAFAALAVVLILAGYIALQSSILRPLAMLTEAIYKASKHEKRYALPEGTARETTQLVNAFKIMQQEILNRQEELKHQAMHDDLTGLPNRNLMKERLKHIISTAKRDCKTPSLLMMDLNGFKQVNDTLGHHIGDMLLVAMGKRLTQFLRESDTIVRLGGDEFAVILDNSDLSTAKFVATKINNQIQTPFHVNENQLYISASIGISQYPIHGDTIEALIQHADVAMYHAKRNKLGATIYDESIDENKIQKLSLISDLRKALKDDQLELYYQPKTTLPGHQVYGVEALLRWNHPIDGFISPEHIVQLAEQSGLINDLFEWVFDRAASQLSDWLSRKIELNIAVNLSVYDLQHHDIVKSITNTLADYKLSPEYFTLEVTESAMMANPEKTIEKLMAIDKMGVRISIDDFGTGYSSLSYLKQLPVDELKIDKSFVMQMDSDENDAIIVRSTIDLAHNLGLQVVAEGVENQSIDDLLAILGCDIAQGYHFAKPMPASMLETWLADKHVVFYSPEPLVGSQHGL